MRGIRRVTAVALVSSAAWAVPGVHAGAAQAGITWRLLKNDKDAASATIDRLVARTGNASVRLEATRTARDVAVLQPLRGEPWRGKRVLLSGFVRATMSTGEAGLVVVVNNGTRYGLYFPSDERLTKEQPGWRLLEVRIDVPNDATLVSIGVWVRRGDGIVWLDDVKLIEVPRGVTKGVEPRRSSPMTRSEMTKIQETLERVADGPVDLDFERAGLVVEPW